MYPDYSFSSLSSSPPPLPSGSLPLCLPLEITTEHDKIKYNKTKQNFHTEVEPGNPRRKEVLKAARGGRDPLILTLCLIFE